MFDEMFNLNLLFVIAFIYLISFCNCERRPNVLFIVADDLGWDDVSFHGSDQIMTPNIDVLAYTGVALNRYYTHCVCTPSRSAILTGKFGYVNDVANVARYLMLSYQHRPWTSATPEESPMPLLKDAGYLRRGMVYWTSLINKNCCVSSGMQGYPLTNSEDRGLPITEKILPQYLKELGYSTHLVGKWHQGMSRKEYLPTSRGFDSHFGHRGGYIDYYEYTIKETHATGKVTGLDLYRNLTPSWDTEGYITDLYTEEARKIIRSHDTSSPLFLMLAHLAPHSANDGALLQAPPETVRKMRHVESAERRIYAAMVKKLDDSIGDVLEELSEKKILNNTLIIFVSDNGGMTSGDSLNYASNYPLRGLKMSPFEGGVRSTGIIWASDLNPKNHNWKGYIHAVDWLPIILKYVNAEIPNDLDGIDLLDEILNNDVSKRREVFEIDDYTGFSMFIEDDYKLVNGTVVQAYSDHQGEELRGINGDGPSYAETIEHSKAFDIMKSLNKTLHSGYLDNRSEQKVTCGATNRDPGFLCMPTSSRLCLFDIKKDPCEYLDLSESHTEVVESMLNRLNIEKKRIVPRIVPIVKEPASAPRLNGFTWGTFADIQ